MPEINRDSGSGNKLAVDQKGKAHDAKLTMVPIFSRRSIIVLTIGLIVGLLLGFAYWLISPLFITQTSPQNQAYSDNSGIIEKLGIETGGPYISTVKIQIVNPDSDYMSSDIIRQLGDYYITMGSSQLFFDYFHQELENYSLEHEYTTDDLSQMIVVEFDSSGEVPVIIVSAIAPTKEEASFIAGLLPQTFVDFFTAEKEKERDKQYDDILKEIDNVSAYLYETHQELAELESPEVLNNPEYIALNAKVDALQQQFDAQTSLLALEYYSGAELQEEYENIQQEITMVVAELAEAEQELLQAGQQLGGNTSYNADAVFLEAKIRGLETQLDTLVTGNAQTTGLTQLIADGITTGPVYNALMAKIETTSQALVEAKQEYDQLTGSSIQGTVVTSPEYELAQMKVDTLNDRLQSLQSQFAVLYTQIINIDNENGDTESAYNRISAALTKAKDELKTLENELGYDPMQRDIDYDITEDRINYINILLIRLNEDLADLVGSVDTIDTKNLLVSNPSDPTALLQQRERARNVLLMGAILGIVAAWVLLNFRWLVKSISSSKPDGLPDDED